MSSNSTTSEHWRDLIEAWLSGEEPHARVAPIIDHVMGQMLDGQPRMSIENIEAPDVSDIMVEVDLVLQLLMIAFQAKLVELRRILEQRGREYGEEVLIVMGEHGIAEFAKVKLFRLLKSLRDNQSQASRHDSWLDLAGYSVLCIALQSWQEQMAEHDGVD